MTKIISFGFEAFIRNPLRLDEKLISNRGELRF